MGNRRKIKIGQGIAFNFINSIQIHILYSKYYKGNFVYKIEYTIFFDFFSRPFFLFYFYFFLLEVFKQFDSFN